MLKYSIPTIPNVLMWWVLGSLNRPILEGTVGLSGIGILAVAQRFPNAASLVFLYSVIHGRFQYWKNTK